MSLFSSLLASTLNIPHLLLLPLILLAPVLALTRRACQRFSRKTEVIFNNQKSVVQNCGPWRDEFRSLSLLPAPVNPTPRRCPETALHAIPPRPGRAFEGGVS